jgi:uncharacterized protein (DUF1015 family)
MARIRPFKALRPKNDRVNEINSPPYDVVSEEEALEIVRRNPNSFLKVIKPEIMRYSDKELPYSKLAKQAGKTLRDLIDNKVIVKEKENCLYIYQQRNGNYQRNGIVACLSVHDYVKKIIKDHEKVRVLTWQERVQHINETKAHTGCAMVIYQDNSYIEKLVKKEMVEKNVIYDFISDDGIRNCCWKINKAKTIDAFREAFNDIENLYIADGHHRVAAAVEVAKMEHRKKNDNDNIEFDDNEYAYFPAVLIPQNQIKILGYHRLIKDLEGFSPDTFLSKLENYFYIEKINSNKPFLPLQKGVFGMNLASQWYKVSTSRRILKESKDVINQLDVSILQNWVLNPLLGIKDPQKSKKLEFIGGKDALDKLEKRIQEGANIVFTLFPTSIEEVISVSNNNQIMPPKSTWFEPKLRSGIFVHLFE